MSREEEQDEGRKLTRSGAFLGIRDDAGPAPDL